MYSPLCERRLSSRWLRSLTRIRFNFKVASSELISSQKCLHNDRLAELMVFFRVFWASLYWFRPKVESDYRAHFPSVILSSTMMFYTSLAYKENLFSEASLMLVTIIWVVFSILGMYLMRLPEIVARALTRLYVSQSSFRGFWNVTNEVDHYKIEAHVVWKRDIVWHQSPTRTAMPGVDYFSFDCIEESWLKAG